MESIELLSAKAQDRLTDGLLETAEKLAMAKFEGFSRLMWDVRDIVIQERKIGNDY